MLHLRWEANGDEPTQPAVQAHLYSYNKQKFSTVSHQGPYSTPGRPPESCGWLRQKHADSQISGSAGGWGGVKSIPYPIPQLFFCHSRKLALYTVYINLLGTWPTYKCLTCKYVLGEWSFSSCGGRKRWEKSVYIKPGAGIVTHPPLPLKRWLLCEHSEARDGGKFKARSFFYPKKWCGLNNFFTCHCAMLKWFRMERGEKTLQAFYYSQSIIARGLGSHRTKKALTRCSLARGKTANELLIGDRLYLSNWQPRRVSTQQPS